MEKLPITDHRFCSGFDFVVNPSGIKRVSWVYGAAEAAV